MRLRRTAAALAGGCPAVSRSTRSPLEATAAVIGAVELDDRSVARSGSRSRGSYEATGLDLDDAAAGRAS